jgi:hypothetical protein
VCVVTFVYVADVNMGRRVYVVCVRECAAEYFLFLQEQIKDIIIMPVNKIWTA